MGKVMGLIFAAGLGTRLYPLTASMPKAMVEVGGEPMLGHVLGKMIEAGIDEIVVNVHHHAGVVKDYLEKWRGRAKINVSDESVMLLDTGGGLLKAKNFFDEAETILLHNADIYSDLNVADVINAHKESGADCTLVSWKRDGARKLLFDGTGRMRGWKDCRTGEVRPQGLQIAGHYDELSFGGIHAVGKKMLRELAEYGGKRGEVFSLTPFYVDVCKELDIRSYTPEGDFVWFDVGSMEKLEKARNYYKNKYMENG